MWNQHLRASRKRTAKVQVVYAKVMSEPRTKYNEVVASNCKRVLNDTAHHKMDAPKARYVSPIYGWSV